MNKFEGTYGTEEGQEEFYAHPESQQDIIDSAKEEAGKIHEKMEEAKTEGREIDYERAEKELVWEDFEKRVGRVTDRLGKKADEGIKETLVAFNVLGLNTYQSCEGHLDHGIPTPWIDVRARGKPEERFVGENEAYRRVAEKYGIPVEDVKHVKNRDAYLEAVRSTPRVETQEYQEWDKKNDLLRTSAQKLLGEFYEGREVPLDVRLIVKEGVGGFRIHNGGEDYKIRSKGLTEEQQQEIAPRLAQYQEEMRKFTEFLKEKYFEKEAKEKQILLKIAGDFLVDGTMGDEIARLEGRRLIEKLQEKFQESLARYFHESGMADEVAKLAAREKENPSDVPLDEQALHLIAKKSQGVHGWVDMLPRLRKQYENAGMNCTLGSAMLHLALEQLGYVGVRTALPEGHHVVFRELEDGSMKLYDPTSLTTLEERLTGHTTTFAQDHILAKHDAQEGGGRRGYAMTAKERLQNFYVYDPSVKMDIAVALQNLSEVKKDVEGKRMLESRLFNPEAYKEALVRFIKHNNSKELSDGDLGAIAKENREAIVKILRVAERAFEGKTVPPNPFDFLHSELLVPKIETAGAPDPKEFIAPEWHTQAQELCEKYPELKQLDFQVIKEKFNLFDGYDELKRLGTRGSGEENGA